MRNDKTGHYEPDYTPEDMAMFVDMVKSGTSQEAFLKEIQKLFPKNSMWAILKWFTKARKLAKESK